MNSAAAAFEKAARSRPRIAGQAESEPVKSRALGVPRANPGRRRRASSCRPPKTAESPESTRAARPSKQLHIHRGVCRPLFANRSASYGLSSTLLYRGVDRPTLPSTPLAVRRVAAEPPVGSAKPDGWVCGAAHREDGRPLKRQPSRVAASRRRQARRAPATLPGSGRRPASTYRYPRLAMSTSSTPSPRRHGGSR